jgi:uncharacterized protein (DUF302 family)
MGVTNLSDQIAYRRRLFGASLALSGVGLLQAASAAPATDAGLVTRRSAHGVADTIARFRAAVTGAGWVLFGEIDHAAAADALGMKLLPRTVVLFGNPKTGTPAMQGHPTLALDLPMRVLVWQDDGGAVFVTRSTAEDLATRVFARHGVDVAQAGQKATEAFLDGLVGAAIA